MGALSQLKDGGGAADEREAEANQPASSSGAARASGGIPILRCTKTLEFSDQDDHPQKPTTGTKSLYSKVYLKLPFVARARGLKVSRVLLQCKRA